MSKILCISDYCCCTVETKNLTCSAFFLLNSFSIQTSTSLRRKTKTKQKRKGGENVWKNDFPA